MAQTEPVYLAVIQPQLLSGSRRLVADVRWRALWLHTEDWWRRWGRRRRVKAGGGGRRCRAVLLFRRLPLFSLRAFGHHLAGGMESAGGFGAGKAGGVAFDPVAFFTHPRTVLRLMSWVSLPKPPVRTSRCGVQTVVGPPAPLSSCHFTPSVFEHCALAKNTRLPPPPSLYCGRTSSQSSAAGLQGVGDRQRLRCAA